ncbi:MAG: VWA domain-containing protein [Myxococcota bacterium]
MTTLLLLAALGAPSAAPPFALDVELARPVLSTETAPGQAANVLRVSLEGLESALAGPTNGRPPVNLALVLDRSGSMRGQKLLRARQAARMLVERLGPEDVLSLVAYDGSVEVLVPATRVDDRRVFLDALEGLRAGGSTALFSGVSRGLAEVRRFVDPARVDRVVLLSDGQANVGPSAPSELGRLGAAAAKEGISISTIGLGLGYNEDLMARLAGASDGNHGFAESAADLAALFDAELQEAISVVAEAIELKITPASGWKVTSSLGRPVEIYPSYATAKLVQLPAHAPKYFLMAMAGPTPSASGQRQPVATVEVTARRTSDGQPVRTQTQVFVRYTSDLAEANRNENQEVAVSAVEASALQTNRAAVSLRDRGLIDQAKDLLQQNATYLEENADRYRSSKLRAYSQENAADAQKLNRKDWLRTRKRMRSKQHKIETQQSY